jgi:outer membrane protein assembly factor BamB
MIRQQLAAIAVIVVAVGIQQVSAQSSSPQANWPQWRGPLWTGAAPQGDPPLKWDATTNVAWKVRIPGDGTSTPVIWGEKIFIQTAKPAKEDGTAPASDRPSSPTKGKGGKGSKGGFGGGPPPTELFQWILMCLDRNTGKTLWQKVAHEGVPHEGFRAGDGSFAAASAMTDGEQVFAFFGSRGLYCYDLDGNAKWQKDLGDQQTRNDFGEGATPALFGNTLVVPWDHEEQDFIVALDKRTGDELWRQPRDEPTGWSTPLIVEHDGKAQVITCGTNRTRSYDLATGNQIWECEGLTANVIPTPVHANGVVYATSGFRGFKLLAIRLGGSGDLTGTDSILWRLDQDTPYVPSPLLSGERLYFFKSNNALLTCLDVRTGKPHYSAQRIDGLGSAVYPSPVAAGGRVYLTGRNGTTVVIRDANKLEVLSTNVLGEPVDASPAVVGKQLFIRGRQNLYCIAEK